MKIKFSHSNKIYHFKCIYYAFQTEDFRSDVDKKNPIH